MALLDDLPFLNLLAPFLFGYKQHRHSAKFSFDAVPMILYDAISELVHHGIDKEGKMRFYPLFPYSLIFLTLPLSTRCTGKITFFCAISSFRSCAKIISVANVPFFSES